MNGSKFLIGFISIFLGLILGAILFFILLMALVMLHNCFYPEPEHITMPIFEMLGAIILDIPLSILIVIKIYKWFLANQNID